MQCEPSPARLLSSPLPRVSFSLARALLVVVWARGQVFPAELLGSSGGWAVVESLNPAGG